MPAAVSAAKVGSFASTIVAVLLTATVDAPYFTATDTVAATSAPVEKNDGAAVSVHTPTPLVPSGEPHVTLCDDDDDDDDGTSMVMVIVRPLVNTRVRPATSCTWNAARTVLAS